MRVVLLDAYDSCLFLAGYLFLAVLRAGIFVGHLSNAWLELHWRRFDKITLIDCVTRYLHDAFRYSFITEPCPEDGIARICKGRLLCRTASMKGALQGT